MKLLIVFTLLVATACAGSSVKEILDKLDSLLIAAHSAKNTRAIAAIEESIDIVSICASQLSNKLGEDKITCQQAVDEIAEEIPDIEKLISSNIKSRNWFTKKIKSIATKVKGVFTKVKSVFKKLDASGLGGLAAVFQPFIDQIQSNTQVKGVVSGLKVVEQGIASLNKMTGGAIGPLNTVSDVLSNIDTVGDLFNSMTAANSTNSEALADALINALANSKSANLQKIETGLDYVCNGLADAANATASAA